MDDAKHYGWEVPAKKHNWCAIWLAASMANSDLIVTGTLSFKLFKITSDR